jgi:DNA-3-methyladenine glycosylase I
VSFTSFGSILFFTEISRYDETMNKRRCAWPGDDEKLIHYHDTIWGVPEFRDKEIWKAIVLDTNQAGLSWKIIWHKYDGFKNAYANFDVKKVAKFTSKDVARLMKDKNIIRNKLKIQGTVKNAKAFLTVQRVWYLLKLYLVICTSQTYSNEFAPHCKDVFTK